MKVTKKDSKVVSEIIESADLYKPTPDQRQVKAEFHMALASGPTPEKITAAFAVQITNRVIIEKWWPNKRFRSWFLDSASFDNEAEALASAALGVIGGIMYHAERDNDRLSAAKLLIEIAGKIKKNKPEVKFLDENIPDDPQKLDEYITKAGGTINEKT
tara:strand:- start:2229 stop:2705 length:477 start_codon:yes stop_codon:yes gene_type:complete